MAKASLTTKPTSAWDTFVSNTPKERRVALRRPAAKPGPLEEQHQPRELEPVDGVELIDSSAVAFWLRSSWPRWMAEARCAGMDSAAFFPQQSTSAKAARALAVCAGCCVREQCLEHALSVPVRDDVGIWGGATESERRRIRAERGLPSHGHGQRSDEERAELRDSAVALRARGWLQRQIARELGISQALVSGLLREAAA